jgi:TnpA family transposase
MLSLEWRANDFILYGRGGEIATNRLEAQPSPHFSSQAICNLRYVS